MRGFMAKCSMMAAWRRIMRDICVHNCNWTVRSTKEFRGTIDSYPEGFVRQHELMMAAENVLLTLWGAG